MTRRHLWSKEIVERILKLRAQHKSTQDAIAAEVGLNRNQVAGIIWRARRGQISPKEKSPEYIPINNISRIEAYKFARRGFDILPTLETKYIEYLKTGMSCQEAARKVGATI